MDGSQVTQSFDFVWFYTNILTRRDEQVVASETDQSIPSIHAKEPPKRDSQKPNAPFLLNQQNESDNVDNMIPRCVKCGNISTALEAERVILGGFDVKEANNGFLRFHESYEYHMPVIQRQSTKMLQSDDDVAMKEHLKSWAYAVACIVK